MPDTNADRTISSDEGDGVRSRSLSNVGASSGDDASEKMFVPIHCKTIGRKGSVRTKRKMRQNSLQDGEDSDLLGSGSPLVGSATDSTGELTVRRIDSTKISRSPSASRSMSPSRFSAKVDVESSDSASVQTENTPIYVSGIKN
ncbi:hypothetical protein M1146_07705 [Patescibacteria group bacterium]|nr:hypothetical protein [Patescibacteria group bacterium]